MPKSQYMLQPLFSSYKPSAMVLTVTKAPFLMQVCLNIVKCFQAGVLQNCNLLWPRTTLDFGRRGVDACTDARSRFGQIYFWIYLLNLFIFNCNDYLECVWRLASVPHLKNGGKPHLLSIMTAKKSCNRLKQTIPFLKNLRTIARLYQNHGLSLPLFGFWRWYH